MKTPGVTYFGETDARNKRVPFGIKDDDRSRHMYLIGKTGMGKSTVLENLTIQDIQNGNGLAFLDPHGKTADLFLEYVPEERIKDVIYFAPFDTDFPISFNVMEDVGFDKRHLVVNGLMSAFKKIWVDAWSARMEYILNNTLLALLEYPGSTLIGVNRMFADKDYRKEVVSKVTDTSVKAFWNDEFAKYNDKYAQEATAAIQNKIGQFISNPMVRNIIGQTQSTFDFREVMDNKKIVIINLSKGRMGEANANLLGSMIITKIYLAAMSRADRSEKDLAALPNFYLYVDEFQNFANESFADILSEARKYKLNLTVAHQYIEQMSDEVRAAVFGNVGTMVVFRVGAYDAEVLEKEFAPEFTIEDLVNLGRFQIYLKLMIDSVTSSPFSASTLPQIERPIVSYVQQIIENSRATYAKPRTVVEDNIKDWHAPIVPTQVPGTGASFAPGTKPSFEKRDGPRVEPRRDQSGEQRRDFSRTEQRPGSFPSSAPRHDQGRDSRPDNNIPRQSDGGHSRDHNVRRPIPTHQPFKSVLAPSPARAVSEAEHDAREIELRKAISLNYLKPVEPPRKDPQHNKKKPTEENLSALKNALMSVLGDVQKETIKEAEAQPEKKDFVVPESKYVAPEPSPKPVVQTPEVAVPEAQKQQPVQDVATSKPSLKEIPEEVLRKMLEIE
jgi:tRNA isopentenyl-2-thiomethyl-A-37 hydroxylase MiaE